jgi:hypothetical protein
MGDPVGTLQAARALLAADGQVLVADERVADAFIAPGDPVERFMYGWSRSRSGALRPTALACGA